jgi:hypothetical protein
MGENSNLRHVDELCYGSQESRVDICAALVPCLVGNNKVKEKGGYERMTQETNFSVDVVR